MDEAVEDGVEARHVFRMAAQFFLIQADAVQTKAYRPLPDGTPLELIEQAGIVGRCSDSILRCSKHLLRIFIYAPYKDRLRNCVERLKMDERTAKEMIRSVDRARDAYQVRYAGYLPGDFHHTDLLINSSFLGVEATAQYLTELVLKKYGSHHIEE